MRDCATSTPAVSGRAAAAGRSTSAAAATGTTHRCCWVYSAAVLRDGALMRCMRILVGLRLHSICNAVVRSQARDATWSHGNKPKPDDCLRAADTTHEECSWLNPGEPPSGLPARAARTPAACLWWLWGVLRPESVPVARPQRNALTLPNRPRAQASPQLTCLKPGQQAANVPMGYLSVSASRTRRPVGHPPRATATSAPCVRSEDLLSILTSPPRECFCN